jgi:hypothetical protein
MLRRLRLTGSVTGRQMIEAKPLTPHHFLISPRTKLTFVIAALILGNLPFGQKKILRNLPLKQNFNKMY